MNIDQLSKFDLCKPGHWVAGSDHDWAFETYHILSLIEHEFIEAVSAYAMFKPVTSENIKEYLDRQRSKYEDCLNCIYARAFVLSLDSIRKMLRALERYLNPPDNVRNLILEYEKKFGHVRHIRDSISHIEDRGRAKDKYQKRIPGNILILGSFIGSRYEFTAGDGTCYGIDINEPTLFSVHKILQSIINEYTWE